MLSGLYLSPEIAVYCTLVLGAVSIACGMVKDSSTGFEMFMSVWSSTKAEIESNDRITYNMFINTHTLRTFICHASRPSCCHTCMKLVFCTALGHPIPVRLRFGAYSDDNSSIKCMDLLIFWEISVGWCPLNSMITINFKSCYQIIQLLRNF